MKGMLEFLVSDDFRAYLLRKHFQFKLIPMLNPDGVALGHFRMDTYGRNLNRYYNSCSKGEQPSNYAVKVLAEHYSRQGLLAFYLDLHGHGSRKGNFMYGNALPTFVEQAESASFCRLIALNCPNFEYESCNFSKKHMKSRDKNEELTKEGCGRVAIHRLSGIIYSYTIECGMFSNRSLATAPPLSNRLFYPKGFKPPEDPGPCDSPRMQVPEDYQELGTAILISILDTFERNPYSRLLSSQHENIATLRKTVAHEICAKNIKGKSYALAKTVH
jgi:hypothetical protein